MSDQELRQILADVMDDLEKGRIRIRRPNLRNALGSAALVAALGLGGMACDQRAVGVTHDGGTDATTQVDGGVQPAYGEPFVDAGPMPEYGDLYGVPDIDAGGDYLYSAPDIDAGGNMEYMAPPVDAGDQALYSAPDPEQDAGPEYAPAYSAPF